MEIKKLVQQIRIPENEMYAQFLRILKKYHFKTSRAEQCAAIFTENSVDGIYSHGVNRFSRFVQYVKQGLVKTNEQPVLINKTGVLEQWNGNLGPGPLNALFCANRVMEIAGESGMGCLAIANTNHWMRGGTYGWLVAKKGFAYIAWTNTIGNIPAWGAVDLHLGNNPLIIAVPYKDEAIVLDMALSQFSYGKIEDYRDKNKSLPVFGGFDTHGDLTKDPSEILKSERALPVGYWKGAGLSLMLDILASILSAGLSVHEISRQKTEHGVSQVYLAIDLSGLHNYTMIAHTLDNIIQDYISSKPISDNTQIVYPGWRVLNTRRENRLEGIPVIKKIWDDIMEL